MNYIQKRIWVAWRKFRFLRLPVEKRVRLEVTTDGRHITFLLVSLYEVGYGVQVFGSQFVFRELMLLRKTAPIPFLYGGKERKCGISISDKPGFNHNRKGGAFEIEQPKVGPKGEPSGSERVKGHGEHGGGKRVLLDYDYFSGLMERGEPRNSRIDTKSGKYGKAQGTCAGADFSNPFISELARDSENTSPTRSASEPAGAIFANDGEIIGSAGGNQLADSKGFLEDQSQAGLQMGSQKLQNIREASAPGTSGENSSSVKFDSLDPSRLALRADLRSLHLMPAPALDCGQNSMTLDSGCSSLDSASLANAGDLRSESSGIFEGPSATSLVSGTTKTPPDRAPGVPASDSSFRVVREFRGKKSEESKQVPCSATGQRALRAPYFMHPSVYHRGLHKSRSPITALATRHSAEGASASHQPPVTSYPPQRHRRFRIGFFGTRDREFYTKHYHFPGMNRFEILEVFLQKFGQRMKPLRGFPRDWDPCEIAVSIDGRGGDRKGKSFLSQEHYFEALRECDFVLSPPGWCMPVSHNLIEAMFCGAIPITNGGAFMAEPLADGLNCLEFEDAVGLVSVIERALAMDADEVERMRRAVLEYYDRFLEPKASGEKLLRSESARVLVNAEENSVPLVFAGMVFPWDVPPDTMQT